MSTTIFVLAAVLAVIPILAIVKVNLERIKENPEKVEKARTNLFIGVAISETIPILLIVYGLITMTPVGTMEELYLPGLIIIVLMAFAAFFIFLQRSVGTNDETKGIVTNFSLISLVLVNAIPIISLVGLFMMAP
ncbi:hypothetical protein [Oceanobacillus halotolerans]|uniref:hypothetical protein n=1 Tax=Oceanobacillus halotolerans TaxID=2663380 RepID=UPI0013DB95A7|nr:hypothetical protein [Oceanobacillus halotolerans]